MDQGSINWKLTLQVAFLRGWASLFVITLIELAAAAFGIGSMHGHIAGSVVMLTIGAPLIGWTIPLGAYAVYWIMVGIAHLVPLEGFERFVKSLMGFACTLICAAGDPLLFALKSVFPKLLPIDGFRFVNWVIFIVVRDAACNPATHQWVNGTCVPKPMAGR